MLHKDDNFIESISGYAVGMFGFLVAHLPSVDSMAQHIALFCGAGVVVTQLVINVRTLRGKGKPKV